MRILVLAVYLAASLFAADLAVKKALTLDAAKKIATAAEAEAKKNNWNVAIAVVDESGRLIYLAKIDETQPASVDIAQKKARCAALYKRATKVFEDRVAQGGTNVLVLPDVIASEGGLPLTVDGKIIGAIGVSGVLSAQDGQVAQAGAAVLAAMK